MKQSDLKAYASSFASFLLREMGEMSEQIDAIIVYGSVASGAAAKESDVDIFVDTKKNMKEKIKGILEKFYKSREATLFRLRGIENEISVKTGELKKWKELQRSISFNGIILWEKYEAKNMPVDARHGTLFYWAEVGKGRSAFLNKLYGFNSKGKRHEGMLKEWNGMRIGKSCVLIPAKHRKEMFGLIKRYEVNAKTLEVFALK